MFPESTYRLQFHAGFTFRDAAAIAPYLRELGVTHVYASPYLRARTGSTHGYDIIDHCHLNPELGTDADYDAFVAALKASDLRQILDIVPNHVGIATNDNVWWNDVLKHGPASKYANFFDIAWQSSPRPELRDKVLLPVLGGHYGDVLDRGELELKWESGAYAVWYYDRRFPIEPKTAPAGDPQQVLAEYRDVDRLDELLNRQHYRLAHWRTAADEINYRRFFDINDLAALRMERQEVFDATHPLILRLVREGKVSGLRVDHPDGLYDPRQYFQRLREATGGTYVIAEKILALDEPLPSDWPVHGTTGYDFLNMVNGLFVDARNEQALSAIYRDWLDRESDFDDLVYKKKLLILEISLASELHMLAAQLDSISQQDRHTRDFTLNGLTHALKQVIACFPVYRTYITAQDGVHESDRQYVQTAIERAVARNPKIEPSMFEFVRETILSNINFAAKFQQLTAPVTAKGIEDTAFYIYNRLISLNEVGGDPSHFGVSMEQLHRYFADRQKHWPHALSTLSTHDTKRSEDVRARINVLSETPDEWRQQVTSLREINQRHRDAIDPNEEYLLYQTLVGAWPIELDRIQAYMLKAMREAKVFTSWTDPNIEHESAVEQFIVAILDDPSFRASFEPFQSHVSRFGMINTLAQTLLKIAAPGVPDTYQGTELLDFSLVDPDNRRPVDYQKRRRLLASVSPQEPKLFVTARALAARREFPRLFSAGEYIPLETMGPQRDHIFAFARRHDDHFAICAVPRLTVSLPANDPWRDTQVILPAALHGIEFRNLFTSVNVTAAPQMPIAQPLDEFPVALLLGRR